MAVHFWRIRKDGGISGPAPVMLESEMKAVKEEMSLERLAYAKTLIQQMRRLLTMSWTSSDELIVVLVGTWLRLMVQDWHQLWIISSAPDNVPIVAMLFLVPFFTWMGIKQAVANDRLIDELEADPKLAKTHHRKVEPWRPGWAREIHVWPYLVRIEFLATVIVTVILFVWSITLNAPLEEPANPNLTMNPSKAPWYFLGLQEMLVYFDPWIAGVVMPSIIMVGLMVFPYVDSNPLGNGYYTLKQRRFALWMFGVGFLDVDPVDRDRHVYSWTGLDLVLARTDVGSQRCRV